MKKTIVVIILAIFIASIAIVNFFGLNIRIFDGQIYVSSIQCDTITFVGDNNKKIYAYEYVDMGKNGEIPLFEFNFIPADPNDPYTLENIPTNPNVIMLDYHVLDDLADVKDVDFEYDDSQGVAVFYEEHMTQSFVFLKPDQPITITIKAIDGSNVSTQVRIKAVSGS